ncbi:hypothetical protein [Pseudanabaena sp. SR411]|uniref:hypothetical protein n=1 Tax=Pseudanabaena sp. SR411 TaxID=1980935 RepID=UPI00114034C5|nr:hypothetical protein [Pseudanabaena sp. SR411]
MAKIIHFTEDSGDIQVRYDIVHIAKAFSSSNLVSAFLLFLSTPSNSRLVNTKTRRVTLHCRTLTRSAIALQNWRSHYKISDRTQEI